MAMKLERVIDILPYLIMVCFYALNYGVFDFNGLYGQDAHIYLQYSEKIAAFLKGGMPPGDYHWPVYYPMFGAILSFVFGGNVLFSLQLVTVISFLGATYFLIRLLRLLFPTAHLSIPLFISLAWCCSPFMLRQSVVVMSDMMSFCFMIGAIYYILTYTQKPSLSSFLLLTIMGCVAVLTRYQMGILLVAPLCYLAWNLVQQKGYKDLFLGILLAILLFVPHFFFKGDGAFSFSENPDLEGWSVMSFFGNQATNERVSYDYPNVIYVCSIFIHVGFFFLGGLLLFFWRKQDIENRKWLLIAVSMMLYLFFFAGIKLQNDRILSAAFPLLIVVFYPAFMRCKAFVLTCLERWEKRYVLTSLFWGLFFGQCLLNRYTVNWYLNLQQMEKGLTERVNVHFPDYQHLVTFGMEGPIYSYTDYQVHQLSEDAVGDIVEPTLLLLNDKMLTDSFKGTVYEERIQDMYARYEVKEIERLAHGWVLYDLRAGDR